MPSDVDSCCPIFGKDKLDLSLHSRRNLSIGIIKSLMNVAARALGIGHLRAIQISYPVLDVNRSSEGCNHRIVCSTVAHEALNVFSSVEEGFDLS